MSFDHKTKHFEYHINIMLDCYKDLIDLHYKHHNFYINISIWTKLHSF